MKIGIDARFLTHPQMGGFKTYTENLVTALAEVDSQNEYILYVDRAPSAATVLSRKANFKVCVVPGTQPMIGMPLREQWRLARQVERDRVTVLHSPCLTAPLRLPCPLVVTIHDMIWRFPEKFVQGKKAAGARRLMEWYYRYVPAQAARRAATVITVSYAAQTDIIQQLKIPTERVCVTHEAAKPFYRRLTTGPSAEVLRQKFDLPASFILAMGSADPRKNMAGLLQAYALLPTAVRAQYPLAIVWTHHLLSETIAAQAKQLHVTQQLKFLKRVSDEDLLLLYNAASLFVFPSLYEGFGLPLLEAMTCGAPVVAANNSSIPEVVGDAGCLADSTQPELFAAAIAQLLANPTLCAQLVTRGVARAAQFSWMKCARETLAIYQQVAAQSNFQQRS